MGSIFFFFLLMCACLWWNYLNNLSTFHYIWLKSSIFVWMYHPQFLFTKCIALVSTKRERCGGIYNITRNIKMKFNCGLSNWPTSVCVCASTFYRCQISQWNQKTTTTTKKKKHSVICMREHSIFCINIYINC